MTETYEIKPVGSDETCGYAHGGMSIGAVITYCEENFDVDTVVIAVDEDGTREHVATVRVA